MVCGCWLVVVRSWLIVVAMSRWQLFVWLGWVCYCGCTWFCVWWVAGVCGASGFSCGVLFIVVWAVYFVALWVLLV